MAGLSAPGADLSWGWWWHSTAPWLPWPADAAPAPALWWSWWWAAPLPVPGYAYRSARGLGHGVYRFRSAGGEGVAAVPVPPTPHTVALRSADKAVPFVISFAPDIAPTDVVSAYSIVVLAHAREHEGGTPTDVTSELLMGQASAGADITAIVGNANAVPGTLYTLRVVATMASGLVLQESIGPLICDQ